MLHLVLLDKFIPPFIDLMEREATFSEHGFFIEGDTTKYPVAKRENIFFSESRGGLRGLFFLIWKMNQVNKIMLHGLFSNKYQLLLFLQPWLLRKCYWVIWGGDLYVHKLGKRTWKWHVREFIRRPVIKRIGHLVTYVAGDVQKARDWYGARGQYRECIGYLSNVFSGVHSPRDTAGTINIQVGNSADPSNNHLEVFEKLKSFSREDIKIYVPLAYGDSRYAEEVVRAGQELFSEKFVPLCDFMRYEQYISFLQNIDIAIFNHQRQQGMGNIINLAGAGKTVYLRQNTSSCETLLSLGVTTCALDDFSLQRISPEVSLRNTKSISQYFSERNLVNQLRSLFS